jgi:murein DD-endopeptidase MepM/ murein hydrolase activator NlpD
MWLSEITSRKKLLMKYKEILISVLLTVLSVLTVYFYSSHYSYHGPDMEALEEAEEPEPVITYEYGIAVDSFGIERGRVRKNQALSLLLSEYGVNNAEINAIAEKSRGIFDVRKFRSGNHYAAIFKKDSLASLQYFVYEHSALDFVVFQFKDTLNVWTDQKEVDTIRSTFAGSIESSLWNTMINRNANPMLAVDLSEIYAWSIDFFGLQQGDSIRVIYDELFVDSTSIGIGKVESAWFRHAGNDFWAIPFVQDSTEAFFDENGNSLRKAFLKAPLRYSRISSRFSNSRLHPILKIRRPHHGIDYAAPVGTPVHAIGDGVVIYKDYTKGAGYMLKLKHNSVYTSGYMHLNKYGKGIVKGAYVKQGDIIGYVGSTGLSTGPHLDFRFYKNGAPIDPLKVKSPPVDPVHEENKIAYDSLKTVVMDKLLSF